MKMLKILVLFVAVFLGISVKSFCCAGECIPEPSFASKKNDVVTCRLASPEDDLSSTRTLWHDAFSKAYDAFSLEELQVTAFTSKESWLRATFDEELQDFKEQKRPLWMFQARIGEELVGAAILEPLKEEPSTIYVRQFAVHPNYQNQGIGRGMMETIERVFTEFDQLVLLVRSINNPAIHFYENLKYERSGYMHPDYRNKPYIGFRKQVSRALSLKSNQILGLGIDEVYARHLTP